MIILTGSRNSIAGSYPRYGFYDPYEVESREQVDLPSSAFRNSERFAKSLLHSGADLEGKR